MEDETRWFKWLRTVTRERSHRGIALKVGVSHTTVRKWANSGVPAHRAWDLAVRFRGDPIELMLLLGQISPEQVRALDHTALLRYVPTTVLEEEVHRRIMDVIRDNPEMDRPHFNWAA